jgi:hypothetical protein
MPRSLPANSVGQREHYIPMTKLPEPSSKGIERWRATTGNLRSGGGNPKLPSTHRLLEPARELGERDAEHAADIMQFDEIEAALAGLAFALCAVEDSVSEEPTCLGK